MKAHCLSGVKKSFEVAKAHFIGQKQIKLTLLYVFADEQSALDFYQHIDSENLAYTTIATPFTSSETSPLKSQLLHCKLSLVSAFDMDEIQKNETHYSKLANTFNGTLVKLRFAKVPNLG